MKERVLDTSTLFRLDGRVALVTGGSRGIGRMIAEGYVAQGAKVYISSRSEGACAQTAAELGDACIALPHDISTVEGCRALAADLAEREDRLDILVNNAGAAWGEPFDRFPEKGWDKVMDLNVKSPFFLTQALHGLLKAGAGAGHPAKVINITSIDGQKLNAWETYSYQASKAALIHLTRRMAARLVSDSIYVTSLAPGAFASQMNRAARDHGDAVAKAIPAGRIGEPEDMAAAAIYLASRAGDYVVGETLTVDGGLVNATIAHNIDA
ncbi:NAD(P)-dependent dehydrogenase (short-subunit alcohol dehydrogenase family) [Stakelama sediminis]|uniref:NAD(P)-dependent dehydrogenase (Short-subunit alcohol dehydrogenase family) n=1 Tax=Stakelama sediminis TaxID=463200 RepID=A0A840YWD6_9SPHN|nr:NAD(P)-dependent dehydrogenase (short-subunit alcohol dehydrogenase family) [Stakelama sediminis]